MTDLQENIVRLKLLKSELEHHVESLQPIKRVKALYPYTSTQPTELSFQENDVIKGNTFPAKTQIEKSLP